MAEQITLQYGGRPLSLSKSAKLVAVRPRPSMESTMERAIAALPGALQRGSSSRQLLGGFQIIELGTTTSVDSNAQLNMLRHDPAIAAGSHVFETSDDGVPFVPTGEVYIQFKPQASDDAKRALLDRFKLQVIEGRGENALIAKITLDSPNPVKTAAELQTSDIIAIAEPDLATPGSLKAFVLPDDPLLGEHWHLRNIGRYRGDSTFGNRGADARVVAAWEAGQSLGSPRSWSPL